MEKKTHSISSKSFSNSPLLVKIATKHREIRVMALPGLSASKPSFLPSLSKSIHILPAQGMKRVYSKAKNLSKVFSQWEVYDANREAKNTKGVRIIHGLRRRIKNPHIYVDNLETDDNEKAVLTSLQHAIHRIHGNL